MSAPGIAGPRLGEKRTFSQIDDDKYQDPMRYCLAAKHDFDRAICEVKEALKKRKAAKRVYALARQNFIGRMPLSDDSGDTA